MLTGTTTRLTASERAREPRSLAIVAWYDGWRRALHHGVPETYPRRLNPAEARSWRAGFRRGREDRAAIAGLTWMSPGGGDW